MVMLLVIMIIWYGRIIKTTNGGTNWTIIKRMDDGQISSLLSSVFFIDIDNGWVVGEDGIILKTNDGGSNFFSQKKGTEEILTSVFFTSINNGWTIGTGRTILKTVNGGTTWIPQSSGTSYDFSSIFFVENNLGWATSGSFSSGYQILKTTNGGIEWISCKYIPEVLESIYFVDTNNGWVVGDDGFIANTTDAGINWNTQRSGRTKEDLESVYFVNSNIGWAVGIDWNNSSNVILKTENGGISWIDQSCGGTNSLHSVFFIDENNGWAVGDGYYGNSEGKIFKTTNGGTDWSIQSIESINRLNSIYFTDVNTGWAVGGGMYSTESSIILKTNDGGINWFPQIIKCLKDFYSVYFIDNNIGWAVGDDGTILKTITSGEFVPVNSNYFDKLPSTLKLFQNYPNPFNTSTTIRFNLPKSIFVKLKVYSILGKEIDTIISEQLSAGEHKLKWSAKGLTSGIYFYCLITGEFIETKKFIYLK